MFGKKSSPESKAAKAVDAAEEKATKAADKAQKRAEKADKQTERAAKKADKAQQKAAKKAPPPGLFGTLTDPKTAKRAIAAVRVAGPVVAPVALKAATEIRGYLDERKAARLGVSAEEVALYRGPTGAIQARIATLGTAIDDLRQRRSGDLQAVRFTDVTRTRLGDLHAAVRAAAAMPTGRRRATSNAVSKELTRIEADLMTFLVGRPS